MAKERTARVAVITLLSLLVVLVFEGKAAVLSSPYDVNQWSNPFPSGFVTPIPPLIISPGPRPYSTVMAPVSTMVAPEPAGGTRGIPGARYLPTPWIVNPMFGAGHLPPWAMNPFGYSPDMASLSLMEWEIALSNDSYCILGPAGSRYRSPLEAMVYGICGNIMPGGKFNFYGQDYELVMLIDGSLIPVLSRSYTVGKID